jgi:hypothetical protein
MQKCMNIIQNYTESGVIGVIDTIDSGEGFWVKIVGLH